MMQPRAIQCGAQAMLLHLWEQPITRAFIVLIQYTANEPRTTTWVNSSTKIASLRSVSIFTRNFYYQGEEKGQIRSFPDTVY